MHRLLRLTVIACFAASPAFAQVTVDLRALDALPNHPPPQAPAPHRPHTRRRVEAVARPVAPHVAARRTPPAKVAAPATPSTTAAARAAAPAAPSATLPAAAAAPSATLPAAPPKVANIPPVTPPPAPAKPAPPPTPPVDAAAKTTAAKVPAGLQLTFEPGQSDLSPASAAAIKRFVDANPNGKAATFNVLAYAASVPHDPSAPRRLSLSRAVAVRTAMLAAGVASAAIYLRALGAQGGDGPPDRVDISALGTNAASGARSR